MIAYAPNATCKPYDVLPRYLMNMQSIDLPENVQGLNFAQTKYFESNIFKLEGDLHEQETLWLKPKFVCPMGFNLWVGSTIRKVEIVSKQDYLISQKSYHTKNYEVAFAPLQQGKPHLFAKYDFKPAEDTKMNIKVNCPNDKYLLDYMRIKIVDKAHSVTQASNHFTYNTMCIENLTLPVTEVGYSLVIEGVMPYNTTEGQLTIEVQSNQEAFGLEEITGCEPVEYTEAYKPWKYGIIFKEKLFMAPTDSIQAFVNCSLSKDGTPFHDIPDMMKYFRLEILDNGKIIYSKKGWNQINLSHVFFRSN